VIFDFKGNESGSFPRTSSQINKAKTEQARRLGQSGASGKRKRCRKGKSCGASCIASVKLCLVDLPWVAQSSMGKVRKVIQEVTPKPVMPQPQPQPAPKPKGPPPVMPIFDVNAKAPAKPAKFKFKEGKVS